MTPRLALALMALLTTGAQAADTFEVKPARVRDEKAVFATVESASVVPARARIGGTVAELTTDEGVEVKRGDTIAIIGDEKLVLQIRSIDAQIASLDAQLAQARTTMVRTEELFAKGAVSKARLDEVHTAVTVASNAIKARTAERLVARQQLAEGSVLAPTSGRVLKVPVTVGTVVLPGEAIAMVAEQNYMLRLRIPERHARGMKAGDAVRVDKAELGGDTGASGRIALVYPQIEDGRLIADAEVPGLGSYFVGERVRVWISGGEREAIVVPSAFIRTRFGVDYARVKTGNADPVDVPVQRGAERASAEMPDGLEILSGLRAQDILVQP